jgi:hypothetical protein
VLAHPGSPGQTRELKRCQLIDGKGLCDLGLAGIESRAQRPQDGGVVDEDMETAKLGDAALDAPCLHGRIDHRAGFEDELFAPTELARGRIEVRRIASDHADRGARGQEQLGGRAADPP